MAIGTGSSTFRQEESVYLQIHSQQKNGNIFESATENGSQACTRTDYNHQHCVSPEKYWHKRLGIKSVVHLLEGAH